MMMMMQAMKTEVLIVCKTMLKIEKIENDQHFSLLYTVGENVKKNLMDGIGHCHSETEFRCYRSLHRKYKSLSF